MRRRVTVIAASIVVAILAAGLILIVSFKLNHRGEPVTYGISFSSKYAEELGVDWRETYQTLIDEIDFKRIRLMSYWDLHETEQGNYDLGTLDEQFELAREAGKEVSLAIGLRQPRWPECHQPEWVDAIGKDERQDKLLEYIEAVVGRYRNHPALISYQLENEVANRSFGACPAFDRQFLTQELELVRALDPDHPVIINVSNQSGVPVIGPVTNKVGFSVYRHAHFDLLGQSRKWTFWYLPPAWHRLRAGLVELRGADTFIHELQAEPWGPKPLQVMSLEDQQELMDADTLRSHVDYALNTGMREIYLWGAEYWHWRSVELGDDSLWNTAKDIMDTANE